MTDPRQRTRPAPPAGGLAVGGERERVLARRKMALLVLVAAVPITLAVAIVTDSTILLIINLVFDLFVAGYVAMLLQIKQSQDGRRGVPARQQTSARQVPIRR